jgi:predicted nuclease of restriction endonuclease-like (RecB) superfamily
MAQMNNDYQLFLTELKKRISSSRQAAVRAVNTELILLYWDIGDSILRKLSQAAWGSEVIGRIAKDLHANFPDLKGFSFRNLKYMRQFAQEWTCRPIGQHPVAQIPWGHNLVLLQKLRSKSERLWYAQKTLENGWSRNVLQIQIESNLKARLGQNGKTHNFASTLATDLSALANNTLKDPYIFDFLSIGDEAQERELEKALIDHIQKFLLELGAGFAFVGRQVHLEVGGEDFYIDLLFYHTKLHCYVVIELKAGDFKPEFSGKLTFYLTAVNKELKGPEDNQTIGILLCKSKNKVIAEYALTDLSKPIGISEYRLGDSIPEKIKTLLPSIEELEEEIAKR